VKEPLSFEGTDFDQLSGRTIVVRMALVILGIVSLLGLVDGWFAQRRAPYACPVAVKTPSAHNGYVQFEIESQHPTEEIFNSKVFVYYVRDPKFRSLKLTRSASGRFASSVVESEVDSWGGDDWAFRTPAEMGLPTPGVSHSDFPFDSPRFVFGLDFDPPVLPEFFIVRNRTNDFLLECRSLSASITSPGHLTVEFRAPRKPFVQAVVVIVSVAAFFFGTLIAFFANVHELPVAIGGYSISLWSVREILSPAIQSFPTRFDLWLVGIFVVVVFVAAWRFGSQHRERAA